MYECWTDTSIDVSLLSTIPPSSLSLSFFPFPFLDDSKFPEAVRVLLTWVERGEVNRRNANNFYSMIQSSNSHIRRLMGEKAAHEKEMEEAKEKFKNALAAILIQCECRPPAYFKATLAFNTLKRDTLSKWVHSLRA